VSVACCVLQAHQLLWAGLTKLGLEPFVEKPVDRWGGVRCCACDCLIGIQHSVAPLSGLRVLAPHSLEGDGRHGMDSVAWHVRWQLC
jgi:hypothetical protein